MEESLNRKREVLSVRQEKPDEKPDAKRNEKPEDSLYQNGGKEVSAGRPEDAPEKKGPGEEQDPDSFRRKVMAVFGVRDTDIRSYSPLALAFLGDGIYSAVIRTMVVEKGNRQAAKLHREASVLVCAEAQAKVGDAIFSDLTEEEAAAYRRGLNSHPSHPSRSADIHDYMKATALETLVAWLYLTDQEERMLGLINDGLMKTKLI